MASWMDITTDVKAEAAIERYVQGAIGKSKTASAAKTLIDPNRDLGFELMERQFAQRTRAVLDPKNYGADRTKAFTAVKNKVASKFDDSLTAFLDAGVPRQMAEQYALNAAADEKRHMAQWFELNFPSTNDAAFAVGMSHQNASHFPGAVRDPAAVATIAAPRRRAAAAPRRKRRATRK